jgi:hypothetical protein
MSRATPRPGRDRAAEAPRRPPQAGAAVSVPRPASRALRHNELRTALIPRTIPIASTAQILALALLRRGLPLPAQLLAELVPSEREFARRIFGDAWPPSATGERPR